MDGHVRHVRLSPGSPFHLFANGQGPKPQLSLEDKRRNEFYRELDRLLVEGSTHPCRPIEELVSLERAAKAALSARFEHGHSGAT